jgi:hypothetical protein
MTQPDFRSELERLVDLYEALGGNWSPHGYTGLWNDALAGARAALATTFSPPKPPTGQIIFNAPPTEEVIRLDKEGFHYKGQFIADAGEAHRLMLAFLKQHAKVEPEPPTDEEIAAAIQKGADQEFHATVEALAKYCDAGVELTHSDAREVLYELRRPHIVLDHWGNEKQ